jgi:hypothetical protein
MWSRTYGRTSNSNDSANAVIQTADGGYAIVGTTSEARFEADDAWLVKTDSSGEMQWSQTYGGPDYDSANSVIQTSDGGYVIAGTKNEWGNEGSGVWLFKTDASGNMEWEQIFSGTEDNPAYYGWWVVQTQDGGYAIACDFWFESSAAGISLIKTDSQGNFLWMHTYGSGASLGAFSFIETSDGCFAIASSKPREGVRNGSDFWLIKTDSNGEMQWEKTYSDGLGDDAYSIIQTSDGGYALAGSRGGTGSLVDDRHQDFMLVKTDSLGNLQWLRTYGGIDYEIANSVLQTKDGGFIMAGTSLVDDTSKLENSEDYNTNWVVKTDASGTMQWSRTYGEPDTWERAHSIIQTSDGGFAIAGEINPQSGEAPYDFWVIKIDAQGVIPEFPVWAPILIASIVLIVISQVYNHKLTSEKGNLEP